MSAPALHIEDREALIRMGLECQRDIVAMATDATIQWKLMKDEGPVKVFRAEQPFKDTGFKPVKSETVVNKSVEEMNRMGDFRLHHRLKWDKVMDKIEILQQLNDTSYVTRHLNHKALKGAIAARESIDVATLGSQVQPDGAKILSQCVVSLKDNSYPPTPGTVRARHFCTGYVVCPMENHINQCRYVNVLCCDLNMNGVGAFMAEFAKPTLLAQQAHNLLDYLANIPDEPNDL